MNKKILNLLKETNKLKNNKQKLENIYKFLDENDLFFIKSDSNYKFLFFVFTEDLVFEITNFTNSMTFPKEEFLPCVKKWVEDYKRKEYFKEYQLAFIYYDEK